MKEQKVPFLRKNLYDGWFELGQKRTRRWVGPWGREFLITVKLDDFMEFIDGEFSWKIVTNISSNSNFLGRVLRLIVLTRRDGSREICYGAWSRGLLKWDAEGESGYLADYRWCTSSEVSALQVWEEVPELKALLDKKIVIIPHEGGEHSKDRPPICLFDYFNKDWEIRFITLLCDDFYLNTASS